MGSMKPPGKQKLRPIRNSPPGAGERGDGNRNHHPTLADETPEEAARAIADALDFLEQETAKLGVHGARELIQRAAARMREFAEAGHDG